MINNVYKEFGDIDIYLFDQLLKNRFSNCRTVLDAGCGSGRNLIYFLKNGFDVYGIDAEIQAVESVRRVAAVLDYPVSENRFTQALVEELPFENNFFDVVISSAVLHFARDKAHFESMLHSMWRVLKPGGFLFARLASSIGIEQQIKSAGEGRFRLPDGSVRYLVSQEDLLEYGDQLGGNLFEPIKTTNVQYLRCMTTWCLQKQG